MKLCQMLIVSSVLLFAFCDGLQCGSRTCGGDNACCSDARLGPTCYDPLDNVCTSNGASGYTLCGEGEQACGSVCFQPQNYFCCSGQLMQKGQTCTSATTAAPTSAPKTPAPANNCPGAANQAGINCPAGTTCCGAGTMTPSCINNTDTSVECCVYFLSSTQCAKGSVCGGSLGSGASSNAMCGPAGSTFCDAGFNENAFCTADQVCCTGTGNAFCCPAGNTCGTSYDNVCIAPTAAPTSSPTRAATSSPTRATVNNCPGAANSAGVNCPAGTTCCGAGTITPSCINNTDTSVECCVYFLSSTQCPAGSVCGGSLGAGASSDAQCGPAGSTFCNAGFNENAFCTAGEVCCTGTGNAFCCPAGNTCGTSYDEVCIAPTAAPTKAAPAYNCIGASDSVGLNCPAGTSCCGAGTITPSCINNTDTSVKCCTYFLSSTQCAADATCGGILGPGASSDAQCGPAGSTFCDAGFNLNTFCTASEVCCTAGGTGFCCPSGKTCGTSNGSCI